jgi:hypothetical protein
MKKAFGTILAIFILFLSSFIIVNILKISTNNINIKKDQIYYEKLKIEHKNQIAIIKNKIINQNYNFIEENIDNNNFFTNIKLENIANDFSILHVKTHFKNNENINKISKEFIIK